MAAPLDDVTEEVELTDDELATLIETLRTLPSAPPRLVLFVMLPLLEELLDRRKDPNGYA